MKTPREILLARHQAAAPKLDAIRNEVIARLNHKDTEALSPAAAFVSLCLSGSNKIWRELIFPSRRIWAGLATVWIALSVINVYQRESSPSIKVSSALVASSFREQQRLLNELFADSTPAAETDRPKTFSPKPRTETIQFRAA